jgi:hypothetical protein
MFAAPAAWPRMAVAIATGKHSKAAEGGTTLGRPVLRKRVHMLDLFPREKSVYVILIDIKLSLQSA